MLLFFRCFMINMEKNTYKGEFNMGPIQERINCYVINLVHFQNKPMRLQNLPITIKLNSEEYVTVVCTPNYIEDMVTGFLISEGIISSYKDIEELWIQKENGIVHVKSSKINPLYQTLYNKRYVTSCCGKSRQGFVFVDDAAKAKKLHDIHITITPEECFHLMISLQQSSTTFRQTGGVHNTALCDRKNILLARMDIGRHNALDKIYGHCLRNNISVQGKIIAFSGRISSEILLKVSKIGCEIVLSKSAPTQTSSATRS